MLRIILVVCAALIPIGTAQAADPWEKWVAETKHNITLKEEGIKTVTESRDLACPALNKVAKPLCIAFYNAIIARRVAEKEQLSFMLLAANTLSGDERNQFLGVVEIPMYQRMDADTTTMTFHATEVYPRLKQSSSLERK
jgi:hypothetical protein